LGRNDVNAPIAADHQTETKLSDYNGIAIDNAAKLHKFRQSTQQPDRADLRSNSWSRRSIPQRLAPTASTSRWATAQSLRASSITLANTASNSNTSASLGTVLHNVDLTAHLSPELTQLIRDTLLERKVIFFRNQHLGEDQQTTFGRQFGSLDAFPFGAPGDNPFILKIVHGPGSPGTENGWHTDVTWMERPPLGSIAQCVVTPPYGGDTLFADSHAAYLGLPSTLREQIDHLSGVNDYRIFIEGRGRGAMPDALIAAVKERIPYGVDHPLVRTHPETGKPALYLHRGFLPHESLFDRRAGETLDRDESKRIVTALLAQHNRPEYICRFRWQTDSIAF
jgi:taurine dioxygenase